MGPLKLTINVYNLLQGRLPIDNIAIDDALEVGMTACLRQLQKTNPSLLLTATELREAERDARYVPAVATALASILTKSVAHSDPSTIARIQSWGSSSSLRKNVVTPCSDDDSCVYPATQFGQAQHSLSIESLRDSIEGRLRLVLDESKKNKGKKKKLHQAEELSQASEGLDIDGTITRAASACLDQGNETPLEDYADNVAVIPKKSNGTKKPDKSELDYEDWL